MKAFHNTHLFQSMMEEKSLNKRIIQGHLEKTVVHQK